MQISAQPMGVEKEERLDPGKQLLLELIAQGWSRSCWDWGPIAQRDMPSLVPYLGERKLLYLFCVGKKPAFLLLIESLSQAPG